jgi:hypothetical protein
VQVSIGGQNAQVTKIYPTPPINPYPFPAEVVQFTIPPGVSSSVVDVAATTSAGSTTAKAAFHYTAPVQSFPLTASLGAGIYDSRRNLYYFTDTAKVQVLSPTSGKWLTPISLPNTSATTQLLAIAESPDGTKLAVSDYGGQAIYVLDPDTPASAQRFPTPIDSAKYQLMAPTGLAITNAGAVYFVAMDYNYSAWLYKLLTSTGSTTTFPMLFDGTKDDRLLLSQDDTHLYVSISASSFWLNTANDQVYYSPSTDSGGIYALALSGDGSTVDIAGFIADPSLNAETVPEYIDWETWLPSSTYGQKLNEDGSILFQPLTDGIDMIARDTGRLLYRIQIPVTIADVYDSLVVANGVNTLAVITTSGVTLVDLSSLPIPAADRQPFTQMTRLGDGVSSDLRTNVLTTPKLMRSSLHRSAPPRLKQELPSNAPNGAYQ